MVIKIKNITIVLFVLTFLFLIQNNFGQEKREYKIFQFPSDQIPRIDGNTTDWDIVPESYAIGMDQMWDDSRKHEKSDTQNLDIKVKVGWVKGMDYLYFLYEAYDNYWDFSLPGLHNDTFELVVDADQSGGPLIDRFHPNKDLNIMDAYFSFHGVHAQNYHIFTPADEKEWTLVWGSQPWIKDLPYANSVCKYNFKPGESGKIILEFWITPFDYAGNDASRAVKSILTENKNLSLGWAVIDYDDVNKKSNNGFWNLSKEHTMYGNASYLLPFKLMPLEDQFKKEIKADWSFNIIDMSRKLVAFTDESIGKIDNWNWDFGDGTTSEEQNPIHQYNEAGKYIVVLWVEGPKGKSHFSNVWDIAIR